MDAPRTERDQASRASFLPAIAAALEAAWPGVRVTRLSCALDGRRGWGSDASVDTLRVQLTASGAAEALLQAGLVMPEDIEQLPPCGVRRFHLGYELRRTRRGLCLTFTHCEGWQYGTTAKPMPERLQRVLDAMAGVIAPALWRPSRSLSARP